MILLNDAVIQYAKDHPEKAAVINNGKITTYGELAEQVRKLAGVLQDMGIQAGERVVYSAASKEEYVALYLAVLHVGAVSVPALKNASLEEVKYICKLTEAKLVVSDNPKLKEIQGIHTYRELFERIRVYDCESLRECCLVEVDAEAVSEILFTSGTTGKPKGVLLSYRAVEASILNTRDGIGMLQEDVVLIPLPLNHSFGMRVLRSALYNGETIVLQNGFSFVKELVDNIQIYHCNCMVCVAAGFERLKQQMGTGLYTILLPQIRYIEFGAGAVAPALRGELCQYLPDTDIYNTWGSSETGAALFLNITKRQDKIWSAGAPIKDIEIKAVDENGKEVPKDGRSVGRLALRGTMLMSGYYRDTELTAQTLQDGWFITNDAVSVDKEDYVRMHGRVDDIISVGGEKVSPAEVERLVMETGKVKECACVGVDDAEGVLGQVPIVFLVGEDSDNKELEKYIREHGNSFYVPKAYVPVAELPRNYMGKLDRKRLKEMWFERQGAVSGKDNTDWPKAVLELLMGRRTVRSFNNKAVEKEKLEDILTAARYAPSGHNMQTWQFTAVTDSQEIQCFKNVISEVAKEKRTPFYGFLNPQNMVIVSNDRRNKYGIQDCGAAIENMLLMAHAHNLGGVWLNSCLYISDEEPIRSYLHKYGVPDTHVVYGIVGLGYYDHPATIPVKKENVVFYYQGEEGK